MDERLHQGARVRVRLWAGPPKVVVRYVGTGSAPEGLGAEGLDLPRDMNRCGTGEVRAMRLGPGEWLAVGWKCPSREAIDERLFAVDVSDGLACLEVAGERARALLAGGTSVDLDARAFPPGHATRTRFARASAIVECVAADSFLLYVDRSIAAYFAAWLARHAPLVEAAG